MAMYRPKYWGINNQAANDGKRYKVVRFYKNGWETKTIAANLSFSEAQSHCNHTETSSSTCTERAGRRHTKLHGEWFDGYDLDKRGGR